jgi:hypothetical protein
MTISLHKPQSLQSPHLSFKCNIYLACLEILPGQRSIRHHEQSKPLEYRKQISELPWTQDVPCLLIISAPSCASIQYACMTSYAVLSSITNPYNRTSSFKDLYKEITMLNTLVVRKRKEELVLPLVLLSSTLR